MTPISNINVPITAANAQALSTPNAPGVTGSGGSSFKSMLLDSIQQVNTMQTDANKAVEMFHGPEFQGREVTVNLARPREDRPPREGGGHRDRGGDRGDRGDRRDRRSVTGGRGR